MSKYTDMRDKNKYDKTKRSVRRHNTNNKKQSRMRRAMYGRHITGGYTIKDSRVVCEYDRIQVPDMYATYNRCVFTADGGIEIVPHTELVPAHTALVGRYWSYEPIEPYLKRWSAKAKKYRRIAKRKFRRRMLNVEYTKGNAYRRDFDLKWTLW